MIQTNSDCYPNPLSAPPSRDDHQLCQPLPGLERGLPHRQEETDGRGEGQAAAAAAALIHSKSESRQQQQQQLQLQRLLLLSQ